MPFWPDLEQRRREPEIMDQPGLDPAAHSAALTALRRINWWSGTAGCLWREIVPLARSRTDAPVRVLDIATGGGDIPIRLWHRARRAGLEMDLAGCDCSSTAIEHARKQASRQKAQVAFFTHNVLIDPLPAGFDVLTCSLFLHHLENGQAVDLLREMARTVRRLVLISDLERSPTGWLLAWLATRLLTRSPVARVDGPLSVQGAFSLSEAEQAARQAGLECATIRRCWPCRFFLRWEHPSMQKS